MLSTQQQFIELAIANQALSFGSFTLKSGRVSPYFFNMGKINHGAALSLLGQCYAQIIVQAGWSFDVILGPAYKGIPLAVATVSALASDFGVNVPCVYNRKEAKDHGEGGVLVGELSGKVVIVDDVMTAGTAVREALALIDAAGAEVAGVVVGLDRQERGQAKVSFIDELRDSVGIPVASIITLQAIIDYLQTQPDKSEWLARMMEYRQRYGV